MTVYKVTATPSRFGGTELVPAELSRDEITEIVTAYDVRGEKDGPAIIPAVFRPCPEVCRNHGKPKSKDCGGNALHRLGANVTSMSLFGADVDDVTEAAGSRLLESLQTMGLAFWVWQTFSHDPEGAAKGDPVARFRILVPFAEPMPLVSAKQWSNGAWPALVKHLGLDGVVTTTDHTCSDPGRVYYLPAKPTEETEREAAYFDGKPLDWRALLGDALEGFEKAAQVEVRPPVTDETRPVDLAAVKETLEKGAARTHNSTMQRLLRGDELTPVKSKRSPGQRSHYECWRSATQSIANQTEEWMSTSVLLELCRESWNQEAKESPDDHTPWETVEHLLETARNEAARSKAEWDAKRAADQRVLMQMIDKKNARARQPATEPTAEIAEATAEVREGREVDDWLKDTTAFVWAKPDKDGNTLLAKDKRNLERILSLAPEFQSVRFNDLTLLVEVRGELFGTEKPSAMQKHHATSAMHHLLTSYGIDYPTELVWEYLVRVSYLRRYDPLKDHLNSLKWDGIERASRLFVDYIKCEVPENGGLEYLATLGKRWLTGGVARGLSPGCKMDNILHLEGAQGIGKTTALDILGGAFYADTELNFEDKDAKMMCARYWLMELAEGVSLSRSSRGLRKGFLSRRVDSFRAPYAAGLGDYPRRSFFVNTTNEDDYLDDVSGHRRDWVVEVLAVDKEALRRDRDQIWAEAVQLFQSNFAWHMTEDEAAIAEEHAENRTQADPMAEWIETEIRKMEPGARPICFRMSWMLDKLFPSRTGKGHEMQIAQALKKLKCWRDRKPVWHNGERGRFWHFPESLLHATKQSTSGHAQLSTPGTKVSA